MCKYDSSEIRVIKYMKIFEQDNENYLLLRVEGSLSVENLTRFEGELNKSLESGKHVFVDLSKLVFIDSSSLGVIVVFYTKLLEAKRHLVLLNVNRDIGEMFAITGLSKRVHMSYSLEEALQFIRNTEIQD